MFSAATDLLLFPIYARSRPFLVLTSIFGNCGAKFWKIFRHEFHEWTPITPEGREPRMSRIAGRPTSHEEHPPSREATAWRAKVTQRETEAEPTNHADHTNPDLNQETRNPGIGFRRRRGFRQNEQNFQNRGKWDFRDRR